MLLQKSKTGNVCTVPLDKLLPGGLQKKFPSILLQLLSILKWELGRRHTSSKMNTWCWRSVQKSTILWTLKTAYPIPDMEHLQRSEDWTVISPFFWLMADTCRSPFWTLDRIGSREQPATRNDYVQPVSLTKTNQYQLICKKYCPLQQKQMCKSYLWRDNYWD